MNLPVPAHALERIGSDVTTFPHHGSADINAIVAWVESKRGSEHTRRAFRIEAHRWLAWLMWVHHDQQPTTWLDKATSLDAAAYAKFLKMPKPVRFPDHILQMAALGAQPFRSAALKPASVERAVSALKTMYADLMEMTLENGLQINRNPFAKFKSEVVPGRTSMRRKALTAIERGYITEALDEMLRAGETAEYHQQKWIWTALLWCALRRHELAKAVVGDIYLDVDEAGTPTWLLNIVGKGGVEEPVPLADEFIAGLKEYRLYRGLPEGQLSPYRGRESTPLVLPLRGLMRNVHAVTINRAVKKLLASAAHIAEQCDDPDAAERLKAFSSHSARHTQVTMIVDATGDITLAQDMARHRSITTTRLYKAKSVSRLVLALKELGGS